MEGSPYISHNIKCNTYASRFSIHLLHDIYLHRSRRIIPPIQVITKFVICEQLTVKFHYKRVLGYNEKLGYSEIIFIPLAFRYKRVLLYLDVLFYHLTDSMCILYLDVLFNRLTGCMCTHYLEIIHFVNKMVLLLAHVYVTMQSFELCN